jgi:hypothetical protein
MKSLIEQNNEIPEMYQLRHKHDNLLNQGYNYADNLIRRSVSPVLYKNDNNSMFLDRLNDMLVSMVDSILPVRNIFFFSHNKYFNGHGR